MPAINYSDYESLTVAELKEMAESQGIEIPSDARKADIIDALAAAAKTEDAAAAKAEDKGESKESAEGKNIYEFQMSSTETATIDQAEFRKLKLTS